jgi:hypothetical protein
MVTEDSKAIRSVRRALRSTLEGILFEPADGRRARGALLRAIRPVAPGRHVKVKCRRLGTALRGTVVVLTKYPTPRNERRRLRIIEFAVGRVVLTPRGPGNRMAMVSTGVAA